MPLVRENFLPQGLITENAAASPLFFKGWQRDRPR